MSALATSAALGWDVLVAALLGIAVVGGAVGFAAGILLDLIPPSVGYFGVSALLLAVLGYIVGEIGERTGHLVAVSLVSIALLAVALLLVLGLKVFHHAIHGSKVACKTHVLVSKVVLICFMLLTTTLNLSTNWKLVSTHLKVN